MTESCDINLLDIDIVETDTGRKQLRIPQKINKLIIFGTWIKNQMDFDQENTTKFNELLKIDSHVDDIIIAFEKFEDYYKLTNQEMKKRPKKNKKLLVEDKKESAINAVYHMLQSKSISSICDRKRKVSSNENKLKRRKVDCICIDIVDEVFNDVINSTLRCGDSLSSASGEKTINKLDELPYEDFVCDPVSDIFE
jgi:hypothetical protein